MSNVKPMETSNETDFLLLVFVNVTVNQIFDLKKSDHMNAFYVLCNNLKCL